MSSESSSLSDSLRADQRQRWARGDRVLVESYVQQHPDLSRDAAALLVLIESEYLLRRESGESPRIDEYLRRFPTLSGEISHRLARLSPDPAAVSRDAQHDSTHPSAQRRLLCPHCGSEVDVLRHDVSRCVACGLPIAGVQETLSLHARPGKLIGVFELIRHVGTGQHGEVWLARDTKLRREVAVKLPRRTSDSSLSSELFLREARAAARLRHPNIVPVHEAGIEATQPYIVSDFIQGITLRERMAREPYPPQEAARLCQTLAQALHHAHQAGIIHRDLKPGNVLLDLQGTPHIADFGLAKQLAIEELTLTAEGHILGTPGYMPPEQARGEAGQATPASDVYSLGVILYELLTGRRPFDGPLDLLVYRILTEEPVAPRKLKPQVPPDLETICLKAMARQPAARYATAQAMADDLDRSLRGEPIHARPAGWGETAWRKLRRSPGLVAAAATAIVLIGALGGLWAGGMLDDQGSSVWVAPSPEALRPPDSGIRHMVEIVTEPENATVACYPLEFATGRPMFEKKIEPASKTPAQVELPEGMYLIVAYLDDQYFHEVLRTVPYTPEASVGAQNHEKWTWHADKKLVTLPTIRLFMHPLVTEDLAPLEGAADFELDLSALGHGKHRYRVPAFEIETTEVTVADFQRFDLLGLAHRDRGKEMLAGNIRWGQAVGYAESRGMRLPDLVELEYLIAHSKHKHPWGDDEPRANNWDFDQPVHAPTHDKLLSLPVIKGLYSRGLEWTATRSSLGRTAEDGGALRYVVRGPATLLERPPLVAEAGPWSTVNEYLAHPSLGLRCASSPKPRLAAEDFMESLPDP